MKHIEWPTTSYGDRFVRYLVERQGQSEEYKPVAYVNDEARGSFEDVECPVASDAFYRVFSLYYDPDGTPRREMVYEEAP